MALIDPSPFQQPVSHDVFLLSNTSDVEILYQAHEFTFPMIYKTSAKELVVFPEIIYIISEISQFQFK